MRLFGKSPTGVFTELVLPSAALYLLLCFYGSAGCVAGAVAALGFSATLAAGAGFYRYLPEQSSFPYIKAAYIGAAFFIAFDIMLAVYAVAYGGTAGFFRDLPLFTVTGIYLWLVISRDGATRQERETVIDALPVASAPAPQPRPEPEPGRITVKKGASLHILEIPDITYIAAMGDYVSIVTPQGRYLKEGTMAYYENLLSDGFVRIHRSTIVNISKISAVELYGKHTYHIRLCSGETLRASASGYRTLRERIK